MSGSCRHQDTYELFNFEYEELELEEKREYENYKRRCLAEADHSQEEKCLEYLTVPEAAELQELSLQP